ncbi:MAG: DUF308 domain-containing protein [Candidatus Atabeyarchaeum deiterrae]
MSNPEQPQKKPGSGARALVVIIGLLFFVAGIYLVMIGVQSDNWWIIIIGVLVFSFFFSTTGAAWRPPVQAQVNRTVTVTKCNKCSYTEVRDFQRGDYVYKTLGKCKECDGETYVKTIYTIPLQKTQLSAS